MAALEQAVRAHSEVKELLEPRTMYLGPRSLLVAVRLDFVEGIDADRTEDVSEELRRELRRVVPDAREIFIDASTRRAAEARSFAGTATS